MNLSEFVRNRAGEGVNPEDLVYKTKHGEEVVWTGNRFSDGKSSVDDLVDCRWKEEGEEFHDEDDHVAMLEAFEKLEADRDKFKEETLKLAEELAQRNADHELLQSSKEVLEKADAAFKELQGKYDALEKRVVTLTKTLEGINVALSEKTRELEETKAKLEETEKELDECEAERSELEEEKQAMQAENKEPDLP